MTSSQIEHTALKALGALSQETRLRIIKFLIRSGPNGATAGDIGDAVKASASRLSFHLSTLEHANLVSAERVSRHIIYRARFDNIGELINYLLQDCCDNHPDIRACCSSLDGSCCSP